MADRIVRGYWDCPYCDSADIDGLVDNCPNCGRHKPENTKYHLKGAIPHENKIYKKSMVGESDVLNTEELQKAGISEEECDGNHKEWVCSYCNSLNNWADDICTSCGSPRDEATLEYGMQKRENADTLLFDTNDFVALSGMYEEKIKEKKSSRISCSELSESKSWKNLYPRTKNLLNRYRKIKKSKKMFPKNQKTKQIDRAFWAVFLAVFSL